MNTNLQHIQHSICLALHLSLVPSPSTHTTRANADKRTTLSPNVLIGEELLDLVHVGELRLREDVAALVAHATEGVAIVEGAGGFRDRHEDVVDRLAVIVDLCERHDRKS